MMAQRRRGPKRNAELQHLDPDGNFVMSVDQQLKRKKFHESLIAQEYVSSDHLTPTGPRMPPEVWDQILKNLKIDDIKRAEQVNKTWKGQLYQVFGTTLHVGVTSGFLPWQWFFHQPERPEANEWMPLSTIASTRIRELFLYNAFTSLEDLDFMKKNQTNLYFRPNLIQILHVSGFIPATFFQRLTQPLMNLSILELHVSTIAHWNLEGKNLRVLSQLPVEEFRITSDRLPPAKMEHYDMNFLRQMKWIAQVQLPRLAKFELSIPLVSQFDAVIALYLMHFFCSHAETLYDVRICHPSILTVCFQGIESESSSLNLLLNRLLEPSTMVKISKWFRNMSHFSFKIEPTITGRFSSISTWDLNTNGMPNLTHYSYCVKSNSFHKQLGFGLPHKFLVSIEFNTASDRRDPCNLMPLSDCQVLKNVCIRGNRIYADPCPSLDDGRPLGGNREIINGHALPVTLETLYISDLWVNISTVDDWIQRFINLKSLHLESVGQTHGLGLNLSTLVNLTDRKYCHDQLSNLDHLFLKATVNQDSLVNASVIMKEAKSRAVNHSWIAKLIGTGFIKDLPNLVKDSKGRQLMALEIEMSIQNSAWKVK